VVQEENFSLILTIMGISIIEEGNWKHPLRTAGLSVEIFENLSFNNLPSKY
jgi:hypothetical protein